MYNSLHSKKIKFIVKSMTPFFVQSMRNMIQRILELDDWLYSVPFYNFMGHPKVGPNQLKNRPWLKKNGEKKIFKNVMPMGMQINQTKRLNFGMQIVHQSREGVLRLKRLDLSWSNITMIIRRVIVASIGLHSALK